MSDAMLAYFRGRHHQAAMAMRDAHRAASGDVLAAARLLEVVSLPEQPSDLQAAVATTLSELSEGASRIDGGGIQMPPTLEVLVDGDTE